MQRPNTVDDFWSNVSLGDGCWLWTGMIALAQSGVPYGRFAWSGDFPPALKGGYLLAHRFSWMLATGRKIPKGRIICHTCDTPLCVRPSHLYLGTHKTNARDREARKRRDTRPGERHHNARLTVSDVVEIRTLATTMTQAAIGRRFGISSRHAGEIIRGAEWKTAGGPVHVGPIGRPRTHGPDVRKRVLALKRRGASTAAVVEECGVSASYVRTLVRKHSRATRL